MTVARPTALVLAAAALGTMPTIAAAAEPVLLYTTTPAAVAVNDGLGQVTLRQAPVNHDRRWPAARLVAKVGGRELSRLSASGMAARLRAAWRDPQTGHRVAVEEIAPAHWTVTSASNLRQAMTLLGRDRARVTFYAAPSTVEQVGRTDPRRRLDRKLALLVSAMSRGRSTYLETYRGDLMPFPAREAAIHPTRWRARWPSDGGSLGLVLGPDGGIGQAALWQRLRASPAGREMLSAGAAAYGLRTSEQGRAWVAQYRAHLRNPTARPPQGDYPVPRPGGLRIERAGTRTVRVTATRRGRVVVTMAPLAGGARRALRKFTSPRAPVLITLPRDSRPGRYRVQAVLQGDGLVDRRSVAMTLIQPRVRLSYSAPVFTLRVPRGVTAVLSIYRDPDGARRALARVAGAAARRVQLPSGLAPGRYRVLVGTSGAGGQRIRTTITVG